MHKIDIVFQCLFSKDNEEITKSFVEVLLEEKINKITIDFELEELEEFKEMETIWKIIETKKREKILTDDFEMRIINLKRAKAMYEKDNRNEKAQWMIFIDDPNAKEMSQIMDENKEIKKAVVKVKEMTEDEEMERLAFLRQKAIWDENAIRAKGEEQGRKLGEQIGEERGKKIGEQIGEERGKKIGEERGKKQGKAEKTKEIVKSMLENKIDEKLIKKITQITQEELEKIKKTILS